MHQSLRQLVVDRGTQIINPTVTHPARQILTASAVRRWERSQPLHPVNHHRRSPISLILPAALRQSHFEPSADLNQHLGHPRVPSRLSPPTDLIQTVACNAEQLLLLMVKFAWEIYSIHGKRVEMQSMARRSGWDISGGWDSQRDWLMAH